jgi:hydroxyacyl-ACP dehydratase HTD2-like protein with hotdog domain
VTGVDLQRSLTELRSMVGTAGPEIRGILRAGHATRFAAASGEEDPVYRSTGPDDQVPCPPMFLSSVLEWGSPALDELRVDGTGAGREGWLPLSGLRLMGGGQDLEFHADVRTGQAFTAVPRLHDVTLKEGSAGSLLLLSVAVEYLAEDRSPLVTCVETLIAR